MTGRNPNVFYELGITHGIGREVSLVTQNRNDVPFDFQTMNTLKYANAADLRDLLTKVLHVPSIMPSDNPDLQLLHEADRRTARYVRLLPIPISRRKLAPVDTRHVVHQLEEAAHTSVYTLYSTIYHSQELNSYTASKAYPTESLRYHLLGVANWVLFLLRTLSATAVALAGEPGATPGPVEVEDPQITDEP